MTSLEAETNEFDPAENGRRVKEGLKSLVAGHGIAFSKASYDLIVVFRGTPSRFSAGRIILFQQAVAQWTGVTPEIVAQEPACIKVFFSYSIPRRIHHDVINLFRSSEFMSLFKELDVGHIQVFGEIILV